MSYKNDKKSPDKPKMETLSVRVYPSIAGRMDIMEKEGFIGKSEILREGLHERVGKHFREFLQQKKDLAEYNETRKKGADVESP